jgi:ammonia channel protein AmtB
MFFLPGIFVSVSFIFKSLGPDESTNLLLNAEQAFFSMVFFDFTVDVNGRSAFTVSHRIWYYVVITVPLTILVFAVWVTWQWRQEVAGKGRPKLDFAAEPLLAR